MPDGHGRLQHFGPKPNPVSSGPEATHALVHNMAVGKTVARVYLGDADPVPGVPYSEYVMFEFTDGSTLLLSVAAENRLWVGTDKEVKQVFDRAKKRAPLGEL